MIGDAGRATEKRMVAVAEELSALTPKCRMKAPALGSLWERLHHYLPDERSAEGLRHKQATILTIVLLALMGGVTGGYSKLEEFARGLNQGQRRRLRCWRNPRTGQPVPVPSKRLPFFKVGKELKELVNTSRHSPLELDDDDEVESADDERRTDSLVRP